MPVRSSVNFYCFLAVLPAIVPTWQTVPSSIVQLLVCLLYTVMSILFASFSGAFGSSKGTSQRILAFSFSITAEGGLCWFHGLSLSLS